MCNANAQEERHPSAMGIGSSKEGFSVFGMLSNRCVSPAGRKLLRLWFLRPIVSLPVIRERQVPDLAGHDADLEQLYIICHPTYAVPA